MHYVVDACEQFASQLFQELLDPAGEAEEHKHPGLELFYAFWPDEASKDAADVHAQKVYLTLFSEMCHRFLYKHRCEPYRSCGRHGSPAPSEAQFQRASQTPACCRRNSEALVQYSQPVLAASVDQPSAIMPPPAIIPAIGGSYRYLTCKIDQTI